MVVVGDSGLKKAADSLRHRPSRMSVSVPTRPIPTERVGDPSKKAFLLPLLNSVDV